MRLISFQKTVKQMFPQTPLKSGAKNVTRRLGFWNKTTNKPRLNINEVCWSVEKSQGLKKGEKVHRLWPIVIKKVYREPLNTITNEHVIREGFRGMTPSEFVKMFMGIYKGRIEPNTPVTVIEFDYVVYRGIEFEYSDYKGICSEVKTKIRERNYISREIPRECKYTSLLGKYNRSDLEGWPCDELRILKHNYEMAKNYGISEVEFAKYIEGKKGRN